jgi:beta-alanine degradation protein BauB
VSGSGRRRPQGRHVVTIDDDRVRVTTWTFSPGEATGHHRHDFDYLVVPVIGGRFTVIEPDGSERTMEQAAGEPYVGTAGTEHDVVNAADHGTVFVEIELKR